VYTCARIYGYSRGRVMVGLSLTLSLSAHSSRVCARGGDSALPGEPRRALCPQMLLKM